MPLGVAREIAGHAPLAAPIDAIISAVLRFDFGEAPLHGGHVRRESVELVIAHVSTDGAKAPRDIRGP